MQITYSLQSETVKAIAGVPAGTVDAQSTRLGVNHGEPLLVAIDALISYAKAHEIRYESKLVEDRILGVEFKDALFALHGLLDGMGAVAMRRGVTTDSKSNGVLESMYWSACAAAGIDGNR